MIKTIFLVPLADNSGRAFAAHDWQELRERLAGLAGAFSVRAGVEGHWLDAGVVFNDTSNEFTVALDSWVQVPRWLDIMFWTRGHFRQEAIYIEIASIPEVLSAASEAMMLEWRTR